MNGREYHFLSRADFDERVANGEFIEHAEYAGNRYGTLRSELERPADGIVLEIEIQGARQVRETLPEAYQVFIAPPSLEDLQQRLEGRASDTDDQIARRMEVAPVEMAAQQEFRKVVVNADLDEALEELVALAATMCRPRRTGISLIKPRLDTLLEQVDSHYACVLVAAKRARQINSYYHNLGEGTFDEYPPPMVETGSKNYLKIALDEVAEGKIKYRYRD